MKILISAFALLFIFSCATRNVSRYSKIEYEAGACYGFCPVFKLEIGSDGRATIEADRYTFSDPKNAQNSSVDEKEGTFKTTLKPADYKHLVQLLDELKLETLKDSYINNNVTDLPTSHLNITFANGTTKKIEDYGKRGTPKLKEVYSFLENLRINQTWMRVTK